MQINIENSNMQSDVDKNISIMEEFFNSRMDKWAKSNGMWCEQVAIVASVNTTDNTATLYFLPDTTNQSMSYANKTGLSLEVGQKVYLFHKYGDLGQGFINYKP